jgi:transposase
VSGEKNPAILAKHRNIRCKKDEKEITKALEGNYREEYLLALKHALEAYDFFHERILECEEAVEELLKDWKTEAAEEEKKSESKPNSTPIEKLNKNGRGIQKKTEYNRSPYYFEAESSLQMVLGVNLADIPGLDINGILKIIAETGTDMSKWPSPKQFTSWLGLCPGNKVSGGKILSGKTKPCANRAAQAFRLAANTLYRSKTALGAYFRRMRARLGAPKAITAAAHKLAKILYIMLKERKSFNEIGQQAYEDAYKMKQVSSLAKRAKDLGYTLTPC